MIVYSVFIKLDKKYESEWTNFMTEKHIGDVMNTGCFIGYEFLKEIESDETVNFRVDYYLTSQDKMNEYLTNHSPILRQDVTAKFGGKFTAERCIYSKIKSFI
ncbi:MAG: DUF4286 family protein [Candidatus Kapabacteria bacterium]|nr:DUF4286 family protein [Ignavibacteriota bacterium]MCW5884650.1 DUF4286 family protein [Candidatus Kapabacteria bacterium]